MNESRPRVLRVIATAFFLFAIAFFGLSAPLYWNQWKILHSWPRISATVVHSGVIALKPVQGETLYDAEYVLKFPVGGTPFTVVIRSNHPSTDYRRKAREAVQLPNGSTNIISYNPANPADIRLRPGYNLHFFLVPVIMTAIGFAFAFTGGILWMLSGRDGTDEDKDGEKPCAGSYPEIHRRIA
jgi:hypothetical protein